MAKLSASDAALKRYTQRQAKLAAGKKLKTVTGPRRTGKGGPNPWLGQGPMGKKF